MVAGIDLLDASGDELEQLREDPVGIGPGDPERDPDQAQCAPRRRPRRRSENAMNPMIHTGQK